MAKKESCLLILVKMVLMMTILLGCIIGAIFYVKDRLNEYFNRGETVIVPDFRGQDLMQVLKDKPAEIIIDKGDEKFDFKIPKGHVIAQYPPPGTKVKPNKKVLLTISQGSKQVLVPDLKEKNVRESGLVLLNAQLREGNRAFISTGRFVRDRVVTQSPLPSSNYEIQGGVDILVSLGAGTMRAPLPNLVGRTLGDATTTLASLGLKTGKTVYKKDALRPKDQILSSRPGPFDFIPEGIAVDLLISGGTERQTATADDLKYFEVSDGKGSSGNDETTGAAGAPAGGAPKVAPPKILLPDQEEPDTETPDTEEEEEDIPPEAMVPAKPAPVAQNTGAVSFVMPDGYLPKEVKFIYQTGQGRREVYSGVHKPNEHVSAEVPKGAGGKVLIYINNVLVEERQAQ
jgi:serine/threonine-protein kinase